MKNNNLTKAYLICLIAVLLWLAMTSFVNHSHRVTATVYHAEAAQCNSDYWHTASNKVIDTLNPLKHRWIAVSRDMESKGFVFGTKVRVKGVGKYSGVWTVQDRMNKRYTNRIDLLISKNDPIGKWEDVEIEIIATKVDGTYVTPKVQRVAPHV